MGNEIGQYIEWRYYEGIEYKLLKYPAHNGHKNFMKALNNLYISEPALWEVGFSWDGFHWIDADNSEQGMLIYERIGKDKDNSLLIIINFNTDSHFNYKIRVNEPGEYTEILNTDTPDYGGSGYHFNPEPLKTVPVFPAAKEKEEETAASPAAKLSAVSGSAGASETAGIQPAAGKKAKAAADVLPLKEEPKPLGYDITVTIPPLGGIIFKRKG